MHARSLFPHCLALGVLLAAASVPAAAQSVPGAAYAVRVLDGQNDFGEHFAVVRFGTSDQWTGFHYVADEQSLFAGSCGDGCVPEIRLTSGADRGRFVSAARRSARTNRPFAAFYNATDELGIANNVTAFTASDFGRTLDSNGQGSDHGWGAHHLVVGGAIKGGEMYGIWPDTVLGGPNDVGRGNLLPTIAVDQLVGTFANWFGVPPASLGTWLTRKAPSHVCW